MSRLDEECIMAVVRNRSGIDSGEIDYSIMSDKFDQQQIPCLKEIMATLSQLRMKCQDRIDEVKSCNHDWKLDKHSRLNISRCKKCNWKRH